MKRILFQGDSITDAGRSREVDWAMGYGYATIVAASMGMDAPGEYEFLNRGISGNRIIDLLARVKCDMINLKPDVMSILIGINDVWHEVERENGVDAELFERYYDMLLTQVKEALPDIKLLILEPFVLKAPATEERWDVFRPETEKRAAAAKRIAEKHGAVFVPLMKQFDDAEALAPATHWLRDGVHPADAGAELIKREWLKGFAKLKL